MNLARERILKRMIIPAARWLRKVCNFSFDTASLDYLNVISSLASICHAWRLTASRKPSISFFLETRFA